MSEPFDDAFAHAAEHLRAHDVVWHASLQFAPADKRPALMALFAFLAEIARIRGLVSDPMPGEIRLQWWRDALSGEGHGAVEANPLAAALMQAIEVHQLPTAILQAVLDGRTFDLYDDGMPDTNTFEGYAGEIWSGPMALGMALLTGEPAGRFADAAGHGGVAFASARVLLGFHHWTARGQCLIPKTMLAESGATRGAFSQRKAPPELTKALQAFVAYGLEHVEKARAPVADLPKQAYPLVLPVVLASQTLKEASRWAEDPFRSSLSRPRWRQLWRVWRASKRLPRL